MNYDFTIRVGLNRWFFRLRGDSICLGPPAGVVDVPVLASLFIFTLSSHWLLVKFSYAVTGCCDYFVFGFTTLNRNGFLWLNA